MAYALGVAASYLGFPPLVGYLGGGLALYAFGVTGSELLHDIGHVGVLLLLLTVGLHIRPRNVLRLEVLGAGTAHLAISSVLFAAVGLAFGLAPGAAVLVGVVLAFSSTVLGAKSLEARNELEAYQGRIAVGVLILQDLVAVALLALGGLGFPSPWALLLLLAPLARPLLLALLAASRHGELLLLYGLLLALGGGALFELVGFSPELGALAAGALLAGHPKAEELSEKMWGLREAFLVAFFLEVGLAGLPSVGGLVFVLVLVLLLPLKGALWFSLMTLFKLRARTGFVVAASLTSYGEFAIIAGAAMVGAGLMPESVVAVLALTVMLSFVVGPRSTAPCTSSTPGSSRFSCASSAPPSTPTRRPGCSGARARWSWAWGGRGRPPTTRSPGRGCARWASTPTRARSSNTAGRAGASSTATPRTRRYGNTSAWGASRRSYSPSRTSRRMRAPRGACAPAATGA